MMRGKKIICIRPFNTFGPFQSEKAIIPEIIIKCLLGQKIVTTPGEQTREFNYVDNIINDLKEKGKQSQRKGWVMSEIVQEVEKQLQLKE